MKQNACPSCGSTYNGRKCRQCGYEHFTEEIRHGTHTHRGEPLVLNRPVRGPIPRKDPFGCEKKTRKKHPLVRFLVLLFLIHSLMPMLRNWGLRLEELENRPAAVMTAQPEPVLQPENMVILHQEAGITIFTTPEQLANLNDFCLYVYNESSDSVTVSAGDIQVNGINLPRAAVVCKARPNEIGKGWLEVDRGEWEAAGIRDIHSLSFTLSALQNSRLLFTTDQLDLAA